MSEADPLVRYEHADGIASITLDDPSALNGLSIAMIDQFFAALDRAERDARVILLTGAGRGFCSGMNLARNPANPASADYDAGRILETHINPLLWRLRAIPLPVIGAVRGVAAGAGCSLALCCDLIVLGESGYFLQAFRHVGLVPDGGSAHLLASAAGRARAAEMMLLGKRIGAAELLDWGLVNRVVPDDVVLDSAMDLARDIAAGPPVAMALTKDLARSASEMTFEDSLAKERDYQRRAGLTADHREGLSAFFDKRAPRFEGR